MSLCHKEDDDTDDDGDDNDDNEDNDDADDDGNFEWTLYCVPIMSFASLLI